MRYHLTLQSRNVKTGPIAVTTSEARTCPTSCALRNRGCYAAVGPLSMHWRRVPAIGGTLRDLCSRVLALPRGSRLRINQAGDLPGSGDTLDAHGVYLLARSVRHLVHWTYTHKPVHVRNLPTPDVGSVVQASAGGPEMQDRAGVADPKLLDLVKRNRKTLQRAVSLGLAVNLSADSVAVADRLASVAAEIGCGVVAIVPDASIRRTPAGTPVWICPAQLSPGFTCAQCGGDSGTPLCARMSRPGGAVVGFVAHGRSRQRVAAIAATAEGEMQTCNQKM